MIIEIGECFFFFYLQSLFEDVLLIGEFVCRAREVEQMRRLVEKLPEIVLGESANLLLVLLPNSLAESVVVEQVLVLMILRGEIVLHISPRHS